MHAIGITDARDVEVGGDPTRGVPKALRQLCDVSPAGDPQRRVLVACAVQCHLRNANAAGVGFDRNATADATAASARDTAARRAQIAARLVETADTALRDLLVVDPADLREHEQHGRALAAIARTFADTTRSAPLRSEEDEDARDEANLLRETIGKVVEARALLTAYESKFGKLSEDEMIAAIAAEASYGQALDTTPGVHEG